MHRLLELRLIFAFLSLLSLTTAQFGFFDQMFGNQGEQQQRQPRNNPSDANHYREQFENSVCDHYLCPDTLACVHFPHHCPCPWADQEDKFELAEGHRLCVGKGGFRDGETARKIELARKGLI